LHRPSIGVAVRWLFENLCGFELSLYLFGEDRAELSSASSWIGEFLRTSLPPRIPAAHNHHLVARLCHVGLGDWLVHDGNSGGNLTRGHTRSISGYTIADPQGAASGQIEAITTVFFNSCEQQN